MRFTWDEAKRRANARAHGLDFSDAARVFDGLAFTYEDDRFAYGEQRFVTLGLLKGVPVSLVHTETPVEIRVISFRRATNHEAEILFSKIQDHLPASADTEAGRGKGERRAPRARHKASCKRDRPTRPKGRPS